MIDVNYNEYKETIAENMKLIVENHKLKQRLEDIEYFIKQRCEEDISETESAILQSIALISNGTIKVVREEQVN